MQMCSFLVPHFKYNSDLIFSHKISAENIDFTLFKSKIYFEIYSLKFFASQKKSLIGTPYADHSIRI